MSPPSTFLQPPKNFYKERLVQPPNNQELGKTNLYLVTIHERAKTNWNLLCLLYLCICCAKMYKMYKFINFPCYKIRYQGILNHFGAAKCLGLGKQYFFLRCYCDDRKQIEDVDGNGNGGLLSVTDWWCRRFQNSQMSLQKEIKCIVVFLLKLQRNDSNNLNDSSNQLDWK